MSETKRYYATPVITQGLPFSSPCYALVFIEKEGTKRITLPEHRKLTDYFLKQDEIGLYVEVEE